MVKVFERILETHKNDHTVMSVEKTRRWYIENALKVKSLDTKNIIAEAVKDQEKSYKIFPTNAWGKMFLFQYDPKLKKELPYYDTFPLVFPFAIEKDGFKALNMHYLPPMLRAKLMDGFQTILQDTGSNDTTKLKLTYQLLKGSAKFKYFTPCVKHYLYSHVRSRMILIPKDQWDYTLFLPLQNFKKAPLSTVYKDSREKIRW